MTEQIESREAANSGASDLSESIRGLQAVVSRKENEKQAALQAQADAEADAMAARKELAEARALIESSQRDPIMDPNRAPKRYDNPAPATADGTRQRMLDAFNSEAPDIVKAMRGY